MKKVLLLSLVLLFALAASAQSSLKFAFKDLAGKDFTQANLKPGMPVMVFFFDPYCDHCEAQAKAIREAKAKFAHVQFVWVTTESAEAAKKFRDAQFGPTFPNMHVLTDPKFQFDAYFGYTEVSTSHLFNKDWKKTKTFTHETTAAELLKYL